MPADLVSRINLGHLYPPFLERMLELLADCRRQGADYFAVSGYRTYSEQDELYALGRSKPGQVVTHAQAGASSHNFGLAVDLVRDGIVDRRGLQPDWRPASYDLLGARAPAFGLVWGGTFTHRDLPHVQLPRYLTAKQMAPLRLAYDVGGLAAVWQYLDATP